MLFTNSPVPGVANYLHEAAAAAAGFPVTTPLCCQHTGPSLLAHEFARPAHPHLLSLVAQGGRATGKHINRACSIGHVAYPLLGGISVLWCTVYACTALGGRACRSRRSLVRVVSHFCLHVRTMKYAVCLQLAPPWVAVLCRSRRSLVRVVSYLMA